MAWVFFFLSFFVNSCARLFGREWGLESERRRMEREPVGMGSSAGGWRWDARSPDSADLANR